MTTTPADHARALRIIQETGATLDQARDVLFRLNSAGIHLVSIEPPAEPRTGPKADDDSPAKQQALANMRAITKGAKP